MTRTLRRRRQASLAVVLLLAASLGACAGGDDDAAGDVGTGRLLEPARAESLAHELLLVPTDLPGVGWESVREDEFDDEQPPAETAACRQVEAGRTEVKARTEPARLARAERELQRGLPDAIPASVEATIEIFSRSDAASEALAGFRRLAASSDYDRCLEDRINRNLGPASPAKVDTRRAKAQSAAPGDGGALAFDFRIQAGGEVADLRYETYVWYFANALVTVTVSGPMDDVTASLVRAAIQRTRSRLDEAAR